MNKRILVVEDDNGSRELAQRILTRAGYDCIVVSDGSDVMRIAVQDQPDAIVMDYHLPGVDGIELTTHLTHTAATRHIPVIALSADIYSQRKFMEAGAVQFIAKPLGKSSLLQAIESGIRQRQFV